MEVVSRRRFIKQTQRWGDDDSVERDLSKYPSSLSFYKSPPTEEISLEEFEELAVARLQVLMAIETAKVRFPSRGEEFDKLIKKAAKQHLKWDDGASKDAVLFDMRRRDHLSHSILRLAYCRTEDLRRWFLQQESEFFRWKIGNSKHSLKSLLETEGLDYHVVSKEVKDAYRNELRATLDRKTLQQHSDITTAEIFQIPFERALELVRHRRAFVRNGAVFVSKEQLEPIIAGAFRTHLSLSLKRTSKALPSLEEDDRLLPMLKQLSQQDLSGEYKSKSSHIGQVTPADIPMLAKESFPLCMKTTQQNLSKVHHLRHGARMQYGLFLKGIGLSLEDALAFWKMEFTKAMSHEKFEKSYAYNIRHNYGKEGKRADYTPYSCMKIIMSSAPGVGDAHGCPFKHFSEPNLRGQLLGAKIPSRDIDNLCELVQGHHYQAACSRYFELTHGLPENTMTINHPNQYFDESRHIRVDGVPAELSLGTTTSPSKVVMMPASSTTTTTASPNKGANPPSSNTMDTAADEDEDDDGISEAQLLAAMEGN